MKSQKISIIILSIFSALYLAIGLLLLAGGAEYLIPGVIYIIAGLASVLSIVGIRKQNNTFLWIGIVFGVIQILDGLAAIVNTAAYGDSTIEAMVTHIVISLLFILPVKYMFTLTRKKKVVASV
ncbi:hypothetical protein H7X65_01905 [Candidatus Parcubacteria bacterium]|nr:hypothetical protein [Candidatus Parcubacteria bacterium]